MDQLGLGLMIVGAVMIAAALAALSKGWVMLVVSLGFLSAVDGEALLLTVGAVCAAVVAIVAASRLAPVRWLFRTLIADPVTGWLRKVLHDHTIEVVEPMVAPIRADVAELKARLDGR